MDCPICHGAMITLELAEVEIDHCTGCGGIWLDAGELEMLLGDADKAGGLLRSFTVGTGPAEKPRKCPICRGKMQKVLAGQSHQPLLIDRCRRHHGLWFDKGELEEILEKAELDAENKVRQLLAEMFGRRGCKEKTM